jgi:hypothetical protein
MMARATGAFLLTLFVIGVVFGSFEGVGDLLLAFAVALAVGVAVAFWLERDARRGPPDVFDEHATRRAVRRGVVRTALVAVVWVVAGLFVVNLMSAVWQRRGDRDERFGLVAQYGFVAAHPGFRPAHSWFCCNTNLRSIEAGLTVRPRTAADLAPPIDLRLRLDLRGRLDNAWSRDLPATGLSVASAPLDKPETRRRLEQLPDLAVTTAVAELTRAMRPREFFAFLERQGIVFPEAEVAVYLEPEGQAAERRFDGDRPDERVSWPNPSLAQFQTWVKRLRDDDDDLLDALGLPGRARLQTLARDPRIHGFVLDQADRASLLRVVDDEAIARLAVGDIALRLGEPS